MNYEFKSEMASDMNGLIEIKVATHHCESTYLDRAKSFDSFCAEHYPDADLVTKSIVLEWIKDALDSHTRNVAYTRVAFLRALAEYQKAIAKILSFLQVVCSMVKLFLFHIFLLMMSLKNFSMRLTVIKVVLFLNR